jgi:hypothetical protein
LRDQREVHAQGVGDLGALLLGPTGYDRARRGEVDLERGVLDHRRLQRSERRARGVGRLRGPATRELDERGRRVRLRRPRRVARQMRRDLAHLARRALGHGEQLRISRRLAEAPRRERQRCQSLASRGDLPLLRGEVDRAIEMEAHRVGLACGGVQTRLPQFQLPRAEGGG